MQHIEELALVLVNAFDLHVVERIRIDFDAGDFHDVSRQPVFVGDLDALKLGDEIRITCERHQFFEFLQACAPVRPDVAVDQR